MAAHQTGTGVPHSPAEGRRAAGPQSPEHTGRLSEALRTPEAPRMSEAMASVAEFHAAFGAPRAVLPDAAVSPELAKLRVDLLAEETGEFADATAAGDIVGIADALADIIYVAYGAAIVYGIDLDAVFAEVHRSNMTKLDTDGRVIYREDGKVLKSDRYTPPDVKGVLSRQPPLPF